jgi:hypothetical protein
VKPKKRAAPTNCCANNSLPVGRFSKDSPLGINDAGRKAAHFLRCPSATVSGKRQISANDAHCLRSLMLPAKRRGRDSNPPPNLSQNRTFCRRRRRIRRTCHAMRPHRARPGNPHRRLAHATGTDPRRYTGHDRGGWRVKAGLTVSMLSTSTEFPKAPKKSRFR